MLVKEFIKILKKFDQNLPVTITDGYKMLCYEGEYEVELFTDVDGVSCVDIGIGGMEWKGIK